MNGSNLARGKALAALLTASLLLAGCLAGDVSLGGRVEGPALLRVLGQLSAGGPAIQAVTVEVVGAASASVSFGSLQVLGVAGGETVAEAAPLQVTETASGGGTQRAVVQLDVAALVAAGATGVRLVLGDLTADVGIEPAPQEPAPGGEGEEGGSAGGGPEAGEGENPGGEPGGEEESGDAPADDGAGAGRDDDLPGTDEEGPGAGDGDGPLPEPEPGVTREVRTLRAGTADETDVYIIRAAQPGPTVMIVGGVHGDETSGRLAALEVKDWEIDAGTLIVLPEAHKQAIARQRRTSASGVDLNRQFPLSGSPVNALAKEIWSVVLEFRPDALLDLHEGWGIYGRHDSVGQTLITFSAADADQFAHHATTYLNTYHVSNVNTYRFRVVGPPVEGSLARKAGHNLGIPAFIAESTAYQTKLETRVRWQKAYAEEFLRWYGLLTRPERYVAPVYRVSAQAVNADAA